MAAEPIKASGHGPWAEPRPCEICGRAFCPTVRAVKRGQGRFCSMACAGKNANKQIRSEFKTPPSTKAERVRANGLVNMRHRYGHFKKPDACQMCGRVGRVDMHHPDYQQPALVAFLCRSCHMKAQASRGERMTNNRSDNACSGGAPGTGIGEPGDPSPTVAASHTPAIAFDTTQITSDKNFSNPKPGDSCHLLARAQHAPAVAYRTSGNCGVMEQGDRTAALTTNTDPNSTIIGVHQAMAVRRLTPRECERLQGFPDDYTLIQRRHPLTDEMKPAADSPRYRAIGNSMAVPVLRWIGERIEVVEKLARGAA